MSRVGSTVLNITVEELLAAMQQAGGGLATGNTALASSLSQQTRTIAEQTEQIRVLLGELTAANRRVAELERLSLEARKWEAQHGLLMQQWEAKIALARESLAQEKETRAEMLGFVKTAALGLLAAKNGAVPVAPAPTAPRARPAAAPRPAAEREQAADHEHEGAAAPAEEEPPVPPPGEGEGGYPAQALDDARLGDLVQVAVSRLSPGTLQAIVERTELPNPRAPREMPTLVAVVNMVFSCLDQETAIRAYGEIGPDIINRVSALMAPWAQQ